MKTKVWIVIWGLKDGGAEVLSREYARLSAQDDIDAALVTMYPFPETANYRQATEAGLKILSVFPSRNIPNRAVRILLGRWAVPMRLKRMLQKEKPQAIHFNSPMAFCFAPLKQALSGIRLLYTCHNEADKHFFSKEEAAVRQLIREHDLQLIALHEDMRRELNRRFSRTNTAVIRNGVNLSQYRRSTPAPQQIRQTAGIPRDAFVVGHVGRFSQAKNHAFLLQVFAAVAGRRSDAHLLLVGNGPLEEDIRRQLHDLGLESRVTILSHRTDVPDLLRAMDVMVFPSFFEGLSVTLVEAQAAGLRCVVSDRVNPASFLSPKTIPLSLETTADHWADIILDDSVENPCHGSIEDYDMNKEIHRLTRLYRGAGERQE